MKMQEESENSCLMNPLACPQTVLDKRMVLPIRKNRKRIKNPYVIRVANGACDKTEPQYSSEVYKTNPTCSCSTGVNFNLHSKPNQDCTDCKLQHQLQFESRKHKSIEQSPFYTPNHHVHSCVSRTWKHLILNVKDILLNCESKKRTNHFNVNEKCLLLPTFNCGKLIVSFLSILMSSSLVISSAAAAQGGGLNESGLARGHRCYVCLPGDKSAPEALDILSIFPRDGHERIPDCAAFASHNAHQFEFTCPPSYSGCLRRALGPNQILVARSCAQFALDDCKVANSIEYCYCSSPLCNGEKRMAGQHLSPNSTTKSMSNSRRPGEAGNSKTSSTDEDTRGFWREGETDDEDLLAGSSFNPKNNGDDLENEGSGDFEMESSNHRANAVNDSSVSSSPATSVAQNRKLGGNIPAKSNKGKVIGGVSKGASLISSSSFVNLPIFCTVSALASLLVTRLRLHDDYQHLIIFHCGNS